MKTTTMLMTEIPERWITVWEFRSVDGKQLVVSVRSCEPDDMSVQHEYQRVLYRGPKSAYNVSKEEV